MIFKKYESDLIKRLIKKFSLLKIVDYENVKASLFCKTVFLLQEEYEESRNNKPEVTSSSRQHHRPKSVSPISTTTKRVGSTNKDLNKALEAERAIFLKTSGTLGRGALREENEYQQMYTLDQRDPTQLMHQEKRELMKGRLP